MFFANAEVSSALDSPQLIFSPFTFNEGDPIGRSFALAGQVAGLYDL